MRKEDWRIESRLSKSSMRKVEAGLPHSEEKNKEGYLQRAPNGWRPIDRWTVQGARNTTFVISIGIISALFLCFKLFWPYELYQLDTSSTNGSRFDNDGVFKITVFEDLHFGEGEDNPPEWGWGPASDLKTIRVMEKILDVEKQDLVVLNGDLITGENTHEHNSTKYLDLMVEPLVKRGLHWASTYGNHDRDVNLAPERLLSAERRYSLSLTHKMVGHRNAGITNYVLPITSANIEGPALLIWFFDSRGGRECQRNVEESRICKEMKGTVHPSVARWQQRTSRAINNRFKRIVPSIAFVHIPIHAMVDFQETKWDSHRFPGINDDDPLASQGIVNGAYTGEDKPFMQALQQTLGLKAVFSGHDHGNDWCQKWSRREKGDDLFLCFGRHTGYGGYGKWTRGARQIHVSLNQQTQQAEVETWIRLEDGSISGRVSLNATFGHDVYPKVRRKFSS